LGLISLHTSQNYMQQYTLQDEAFNSNPTLHLRFNMPYNIRIPIVDTVM
jgi:hypothetical protein